MRQVDVDTKSLVDAIILLFSEKNPRSYCTYSTCYMVTAKTKTVLKGAGMSSCGWGALRQILTKFGQRKVSLQDIARHRRSSPGTGILISLVSVPFTLLDGI